MLIGFKYRQIGIYNQHGAINYIKRALWIAESGLFEDDQSPFKRRVGDKFKIKNEIKHSLSEIQKFW